MQVEAFQFIINSHKEDIGPGHVLSLSLSLSLSRGCSLSLSLSWLLSLPLSLSLSLDCLSFFFLMYLFIYFLINLRLERSALCSLAVCGTGKAYSRLWYRRWLFSFLPFFFPFFPLFCLFSLSVLFFLSFFLFFSFSTLFLKAEWECGWHVFARFISSVAALLSPFRGGSKAAGRLTIPDRFFSVLSVCNGSSVVCAWWQWYQTSFPFFYTCIMFFIIHTSRWRDSHP